MPNPKLFIRKSFIWLFSLTTGNLLSLSALIFLSHKWKLIFFFVGLSLRRIYLNSFEALQKAVHTPLIVTIVISFP